MREYFKECKNMKEVNSFLRRHGLEGFCFYESYGPDIAASWETVFCRNMKDTSAGVQEFDWDGWYNKKETKGVSLQVHPDYTVFITKYTRKDIEQMELELGGMKK